MKRCSKCGELKNLDRFYSDKSREDGKDARCKECSKAKNKKYRRNQKSNPKKKYVKHKTDTEQECTCCHKILSYDNFYVRKSGRRFEKCILCTIEINEKERRCRGVKKKFIPSVNNDIEKECAICHKILPLENFRTAKNKKAKRYHIAYCIECKRNEDIFWKKQYRINCREKYLMLARYNGHIRKARKLNADTGLVTKEFLENIYNTEICYYCGETVPKGKRTCDHVIPLSKGGLHDPSNLVMACKPCNSKKHDRSVEKFLSDLRREFPNKIFPGGTPKENVEN